MSDQFNFNQQSSLLQRPIAKGAEDYCFLISAICPAEDSLSAQRSASYSLRYQAFSSTVLAGRAGYD
ncbi:hypothetical protein [Bombilactobacillus bombi]|uniref:hypothetical protein n=1 Tax=Bombilactobacillus bombi TaxID=1303590 RepID=UPI0015E5DE72|nr:hypothetical protein [Bombilactobacillus bombi]MBA1435197.1 hypothetical protein [Bombilactobacillus bombi]